MGCARGYARGCSFADLGLASCRRHAGRRTLGAASRLGIATASSRALTELERTHTGFASGHARAFMGRACAICTSAAASCGACGSGMGSTRRSGSRAGQFRGPRRAIMELGPSSLGPAKTRGPASCGTRTGMERAPCSVGRPTAHGRTFVGRTPGRRLVGCAEDRGAGSSRCAIVVGA
jgi:hypothetical protein